MKWPRWPAIAAPSPKSAPGPLWQRLLWLGGIWAASVGALLLVAMLLRWVLRV